MDQSEVRINTIHSAVGAINETDVVLADASNAIIIGFGVRPDGKARSAAEREASRSVATTSSTSASRSSTRPYRHAQAHRGRGRHGYRDRPGHLQGAQSRYRRRCPRRGGRDRRDRFRASGARRHRGLQRQDRSMRHYKDEAKSLKSGSEGGIGLENFQDIKPGDQIEGYRIDQVARTE